MLDELPDAEQKAATQIVAAMTLWFDKGEAAEDEMNDLLGDLDTEAGFLVAFGLLCGLIENFCTEMEVTTDAFVQHLGLSVAGMSQP